MKIKCLIRMVISLVLPLLIYQDINSQPFRLFAVSDLERVFGDGYNLPSQYDTLKLFGIKGETISGQIVIHPSEKLENVSVESGEFSEMISHHLLPAGNAQWNFTGDIMLRKNASNQPLEAITRKAPALFPDYLRPEKELEIKAGAFQSVWLTLKIPEDAVPGEYRAAIIVKSSRGNSTLPIDVTIYPLIMPEKRHLKVTEWYSTKDFEKFHGIKDAYSPEWFEMLRIYAGNMADHRQNVFQVPMSSIVIIRNDTGLLEFGFDNFDRIAQTFWNTGKMDYLETGELARFGEGGFSSTEIIFKDFNVKLKGTGVTEVMRGTDVLPGLLPAFEGHLRKKGWLDKTLFHVKDEPSHHNALSWIAASSYIHKYAPDLIRIDALCTSFLFGNIEISVPKLDHLDAGYEIYRKEQMKGAELWFYTVGIYQGSIYPNKTIDMPLIDNRILHWLNYKYDLTGYLHWGWNQWTDDPYNNADIHIGDGWHVYPAKDGVINSLRWEQMRNGIQDYEYFKILENKITRLRDSLGSRFTWIDPTQRGKEIISQVITDLKEHSDDPIALYNAKRDLIKEILDLEKSPQIYIQTNPKEHGKIVNRSVVELLGWTEPGTEVIVNKVRLPVAKDGLFMERFLIYKGEKLDIMARKGDEEKALVRNYNITF